MLRIQRPPRCAWRAARHASLAAHADPGVHPPAGTCDGRPCWQSKPPKLYKHKNKSATPSGIDKVQLKAGDNGKAKLKVQGKGEALPSVALPFDLPVVVQVQRRGSSECWEAQFDAGGVTRNEPEKFKGKATGP